MFRNKETVESRSIKLCPWCSQTIPSIAKTCVYCHHKVDNVVSYRISENKPIKKSNKTIQFKQYYKPRHAKSTVK